MKILKFFLLAAVSAAVFFATSMNAEARMWTQQSTGKQIDATLDKVENGVAYLRLKDGRVGPVKLSDLSADDQAFITDYLKPKPAGGWPQFRGPNRDGISTDTGLKKQWPADGPSKVWSYNNAGNGYSSVSVTGGKLYTSGTRESDVVIICLDAASGEEQWSTVISQDDKEGYLAGWGHGPRGTPTFSEGMVFAMGPKGTVACLDAKNGSAIWKKHMGDDFAGEPGKWGYASSLLIDGAKLVLAPGGKKAGIVALNKKTGDLLWKADEVKPGMAEYATIVPANINGIDQYIRLFMKEIVSVNAESGKVVWRSEWPGATAVIPTPIVDGNEIFVGSGYGVGCKMITIDENNKATDKWNNKVMKNHHGGFVKVGDHLYGFSDGAGLICQSWETGEMVWQEKDPQFLAKGAITVADGMIYALNEQNGGLTLTDLSPDGYQGPVGRFVFGPQSKIRSTKGRIWSHPVVIDGKLYLRDQELIYCYDVKS
ncbi:PQQ-like beta-propeller repeat protein [Verrucomicrobiales bacterium]|nr:PQQ-like beta-propeller repeat protein [Verrucomicrobiales bacterium]